MRVGWRGLGRCGFALNDFRIAGPLSYYINPEVTDYYVCVSVCVSPTQYAHTVRCTDEVMCTVQERYGKVRYCTVQ